MTTLSHFHQLSVLLILIAFTTLPGVVQAETIYTNSGNNLIGWDLTNSGSNGGIVVDNGSADSPTEYILMGWSGRATTMTSNTTAFDETIASNTRYILTAQVRLSPTFATRDTWGGDEIDRYIDFKMLADSDDVATDTVVVANSGTQWTDIELDVPSASFVGHVDKKLHIHFGKADIGNGEPVIWLRNVQIEAVPEPSTLTLTALAFLGLSWYCWQRRR